MHKFIVVSTVVMGVVLAGCATSSSPTVPTTAKTTTLSVPTTISPPGGDRTTTTTLPPSISACTASQLTVGGFGTSGALGTDVTTIRIENSSLLPCSLRGYPAVTFLGTGNAVLHVTLGHGSGFWPAGVPKILLPPGIAASAGWASLWLQETSRRQVRRVLSQPPLG